MRLSRIPTQVDAERFARFALCTAVTLCDGCPAEVSVTIDAFDAILRPGPQ